MCIDRLEEGEKPICVLACPSRALDFGPIDSLIASYGDRRDLQDMPSSLTTRPAVVFKPHGKKHQLVAYDVERALKLLQWRDPLHRVFTSIDDVTEIAKGIVGRSELVIKHESADELMRLSRNDEG